MMEMSKEKVETSSTEDKTKYIRTVKPEKRIEAMNFIKDLFCSACPYDSECSSRYPEYLIKCIYLEEWAMKKYKQHVDKGSIEDD
jgi:hypothetical protein